MENELPDCPSDAFDSESWVVEFLRARLDEIHSTDAPRSTFASVESPANLRELLEADNVPLNQLESVKHYLKSNHETPESARRRAAVALYFAVIAKALLSHNARITNLDNLSLLEGLVWTMNREWLPQEARNLARNAFIRLNS